MLATVNSLRLVQLPHFFEDNGNLVVLESMVNVPFMIARVFVVRAPDGAIRGQHAHRECSQFLACPSGAVEVICDDGQQTAEFVLNHPNLGLFVPPGIWSQQTYRGSHTTLTVLCDRRYDANEYIRNYPSFQAFRGNTRGD